MGSPYPGQDCGRHRVRLVEFGQMAGAGDGADLVRAADAPGDALRHSSRGMIRSCSPHSSRVGALISGRRFSSRVLPSGQKMRAAASMARVCSIGHSIELAPSGIAFSAFQVSGSAHIRPGTCVGRAAPRDRSAGRLSSNRPNGAISASLPHRIRPERRHLGGQRGADRTAGEIGARPARPWPGCSPHRQQPVEMRVQHAVAAVAAGEAGQRGHDHRAALGQPVEERAPSAAARRSRPGSRARAAALAPDAGRKAVDVDGRDVSGSLTLHRSVLLWLFGRQLRRRSRAAAARSAGSIGCGHQRSSQSAKQVFSFGITCSANSFVLYWVSSLLMLPNCISSIRWPTFRSSASSRSCSATSSGEPMMT